MSFSDKVTKVRGKIYYRKFGWRNSDGYTIGEVVFVMLFSVVVCGSYYGSVLDWVRYRGELRKNSIIHVIATAKEKHIRAGGRLDSNEKDRFASVAKYISISGVSPKSSEEMQKIIGCKTILVGDLQSPPQIIF